MNGSSDDQEGSRSPFTLLLSGVSIYRRPIVAPQQYRHIYPPKGVGLKLHHTLPQDLRHRLSRTTVASPGDHLRRVDLGAAIGISKEDHVETLPSEHSGCGPGQAGTRGSVQNLDQNAMLPRGHGVSMFDRRRRRQGRPQRNGGDGPTQYAENDQRDDDGVTREFQNRTVGSGRGQPDATICARRSPAISRSTPRESAGKRRANSARRSRSKERPGSR